MPLVDMPVEKLFEYKGISPCPKDIDEYWDKALAEMNRVNHKAEFIKKDFPSKLQKCMIYIIQAQKMREFMLKSQFLKIRKERYRRY